VITDDLSPLLTPAGQSDLGFHQGEVVAWDAVAGTNIIAVSGTVVTNVSVLSTADSVLLVPGDQVGMLRFKSAWFILGRFVPAGTSRALAIAPAVVPTVEFTNSAVWADLPTVGPSVTANIGSSRRCLVFVSCGVFPPVDEGGSAHFNVRGASTIDPSSNIYNGAFVSNNFGNTAAAAAATRVYVLTAANGLNAGVNIFKMIYATSTAGFSVYFQDRTLVVMPF